MLRQRLVMIIDNVKEISVFLAYLSVMSLRAQVRLWQRARAGWCTYAWRRRASSMLRGL